MIGLFAEPSRHECSRAGCRAEARFRVLWRNPKIHEEGRVKTWLACEEHREFLVDFLASRSFPVRSEPFPAEPSPAEPSPAEPSPHDPPPHDPSHPEESPA